MPMTSLVKLRTSLMARCSFCDSRRVTVLSMTLTDGTPVQFASCHRCEGKRWSQDDGSLPLESVLDRARKRT